MSVKLADGKIGDLIDRLKEIGVFNETAIIVTADYGEMLREHGVYFNHHTLYEKTLQVPWFAMSPDMTLPGVQSSSCYPTLPRPSQTSQIC